MAQEIEMLTVYIESDGGDGDIENVGNHSVANFDECLKFMHNTWIRCNFSSEIYEFRVSISSKHLRNVNGSSFFNLGKYVLSRKSNEIDIFDTDSDELLEEFDLEGFSAEQQKMLNDLDLFKARFEYLMNPNNHHRILGKWLRFINEDLILEDLIEASTGIVDVSSEMLGNAVLASLLQFSKQHGKAVEMLNWLASADGAFYLSHFDEYNSIAPRLLRAAIEATKTFDFVSDKDTCIEQLISNSFVSSIPLPELL
jgi:hypothetical protein